MNVKPVQQDLRGAKSFAVDCAMVLFYLIIPAGFALGVYGVYLVYAFTVSHMLVHLLP